MKKRWFLLAIIVVIVLILATVVVIQPFFSHSSIVSHDELDGYFLIYLTEYGQLVEENMGLLDSGIFQGNSSSGSQNLTFYWQRPYQVQGVISSFHGAALFLSRSSKEEFEVTDSNEAIEYYFWPSMAKNTTNLPSIRILQATSYYVLDTQIAVDGAVMYIDPGANLIYTGQGHVFSFPKGTGAVIFFGTLMEDNRLILKGSNNGEDWSELQARIDSLDRFLWDCKDILNETTLQSLKTKYTLPLLLERISARMNDGSYKGNRARLLAVLRTLRRSLSALLLCTESAPKPLEAARVFAPRMIYESKRSNKTRIDADAIVFVSSLGSFHAFFVPDFSNQKPDRKWPIDQRFSRLFHAGPKSDPSIYLLPSPCNSSN
jgi:flagellar basal body-associated protein FliL